MKIFLQQNLLFFLVIFSLASSCSSRKLKKDYEVVDASHAEIPGWVSDFNAWANEKYEDDEEEGSKERKYTYYSYTSSAKNDRVIACELAGARSANTVASEIMQTLTQKMRSDIQGESSIGEDAAVEYVHESLEKDVETSLTGLKEVSTYWEKIRFKKELGARMNATGYTCSKLYRISNDVLEKLYKKALKYKKTKTPSQ